MAVATSMRLLLVLVLLLVLAARRPAPTLTVAPPDGYQCTTYLQVERSDSLTYQVDCARTR